MFGLSPQLLAIGGLALLLSVGVSYGGGYWSGYGSGKKHVQTQWDADIQARTQKQIEQEVANRAKERGWENEMQTVQNALAEATAETQAQLDAALTGISTDNLKLRQQFRACQSRGVPKAAEAPSGDDAAGQGGLSTADQELALRIGADADRVVAKLTACQSYARTVSNDH